MLGLVLTAAIAGGISYVSDSISGYFFDRKIEQVEKQIEEADTTSIQAEADAEGYVEQTKPIKEKIKTRQGSINQKDNEITKAKKQSKILRGDVDRVISDGPRRDVPVTELDRKLSEITKRRSDDAAKGPGSPK